MKLFKTLFLLLFINPFLWAQTVPDMPNPPRLVNDFSNLFSPDQQRQLEQQLVNFANATSTQIVLVVTDDLLGLDKAQYAVELGHKWGVGQKSKDNGIVFLIKPKKGRQKGEVFIATGYGLEGVIPDVVAKRITENEVIPRFKQNDYFNGVLAGLDVMQKLSLQEFAASEYLAKTQPKKSKGKFGFIPLLIFLFVLYTLFKSNRSQTVGGKSGLSFLAQMLLLSSMGRHGGAYRDFSSGSGGFGGGGFGGFGGGGFGGGGAGGSW